MTSFFKARVGEAYQILPVHWEASPTKTSAPGYCIAHLHTLIDKHYNRFSFACPKAHKLGPCYCDEYLPATDLLRQLNEMGREATAELRADRIALRQALNKPHITPKQTLAFNMCLVREHRLATTVRGGPKLVRDLKPQLFLSSAVKTFKRDIIDSYMRIDRFGVPMGTTNYLNNIFLPERARVLTVSRPSASVYQWQIEPMKRGKYKHPVAFYWKTLWSNPEFRARLTDLSDFDRFNTMLEYEVLERISGLPILPPKVMTILRKYQSIMVNKPPAEWWNRHE